MIAYPLLVEMPSATPNNEVFAIETVVSVNPNAALSSVLVLSGLISTI